MNRKIFIVSIAILLVVGIGFFGRGRIRDLWVDLNRPELPTARAYQPPSETSSDVGTGQDAPPAPVEGGYATSEHFTLESSPQTSAPKIEPADPLEGSIKLPEELNLDVPWMSQAPESNWDMPYQEACEEASLITVDRFYKNISGKISITEADSAIKDLVAWQNERLGEYKDTDATTTAMIMREYFGYEDVRVEAVLSVDDIKFILAKGYPVIMPFSGKALKNPNFKNGGPLYHMLVIKGYTKDGMFITSDPGTRKGQDYLYDFDTIYNAAHDWNDGKVDTGKKVMIVALPKIK